MKRVQDLVGQSFGRLTVKEYAGRSPSNKVLWSCECSCGTTCQTLAASLKSGATKSCGCLHRESTGNRFRTHGGCRSSEYGIWVSMHERCTNPNDKEFHNYGGRGVSVCERWQDFLLFLGDMGKRPSSKHSIERKDNLRGYSPENCKWALPAEQANNRRNVERFTHNGVTQTISGWSKTTGIKHGTLYYRLVIAGWPVERALKI